MSLWMTFLLEIILAGNFTFRCSTKLKAPACRRFYGLNGRSSKISNNDSLQKTKRAYKEEKVSAGTSLQCTMPHQRAKTTARIDSLCCWVLFVFSKRNCCYIPFFKFIYSSNSGSTRRTNSILECCRMNTGLEYHVRSTLDGLCCQL
jgi:hypothetical protein